MTVKEFLNLYDIGYQFDEDELKDIFNMDFDENENDQVFLVEEETGDNRRWSRMEYRYIKINNRYFLAMADIGLTEYQDNEYLCQPEEMSLKVETKVITVTENIWTPIMKGETNQ